MSYLGAISMPCCIKAARQNQNVLNIVKSLLSVCSPRFCSRCHSYGENRLTKNRITLMPTQASAIHIQISGDNGSIKLNIFGFSGSRLYTMILMPRFMKGMENSTALSRDNNMVRPATTMSASWRTSSPTIPFQFPLASGMRVKMRFLLNETWQFISLQPGMSVLFSIFGFLNFNKFSFWALIWM